MAAAPLDYRSPGTEPQRWTAHERVAVICVALLLLHVFFACAFSVVWRHGYTEIASAETWVIDAVLWLLGFLAVMLSRRRTPRLTMCLVALLLAPFAFFIFLISVFTGP
jgi:hypothetical protein